MSGGRGFAAYTLSGPLDQSGLRHLHGWWISPELDLATELAGAQAHLRHARVDLVQFDWHGVVPAALFAHDYVAVRATAGGAQVIDNLAAEPFGQLFVMQRRMLAVFDLAPRTFFDLGETLARHGVRVDGVLHVGAHEGQEHATYEQLGVSRCLFVEANPDVFQRLTVNVGHKPGVSLAQVAIADREGTMTLHRTSFDQSSSLLALGQHREVYPMVGETDRIDVRTTTLDRLLAELGLRAADYQLLHVDVQGAEAMVLRGAADTLKSIRAVSIEVNFTEMYQGCAQIEDIDDLLAAAGFRRVALSTPMHPSWGDALYVRP